MSKKMSDATVFMDADTQTQKINEFLASLVKPCPDPIGEGLELVKSVGMDHCFSANEQLTRFPPRFTEEQFRCVCAFVRSLLKNDNP